MTKFVAFIGILIFDTKGAAMSSSSRFFQVLQSYPIKIDRPAGSTHPQYPSAIYPVDYGYIDAIQGSDGEGLDVFVGTSQIREISAVILCIDLLKAELESKILIGCASAEVEKINVFLEESLHLMTWRIYRESPDVGH